MNSFSNPEWRDYRLGMMSYTYGIVQQRPIAFTFSGRTCTNVPLVTCQSRSIWPLGQWSPVRGGSTIHIQAQTRVHVDKFIFSSRRVQRSKPPRVCHRSIAPELLNVCAGNFAAVGDIEA
jgi:hypothetical protein